MTAILFLGANPQTTTRLALDYEVREIKQRLLLSAHRDSFQLIQEWAVRPEDIQEHLMRHKPEVVHFSGHGSSFGQIVLDDGRGGAVPVSRETLANTFRILKKNIRCVVLDACFSIEQARAIAEHIDCVVGMNCSVKDTVAITFAGAFYRGLAFGESVKSAFDLGCNQVDLAVLGQADVPQLVFRTGVSADKVFIHAQALGYGQDIQTALKGEEPSTSSASLIPSVYDVDLRMPMDLIEALADTYPDMASARALWERAGGAARDVENIPRPRDLWQTLWKQSLQGARVRPVDLLSAALNDMPNQQVFKRYLKFVEAQRKAMQELGEESRTKIGGIE